MGRLIRISIYALIILILYFWITAIIKSYQNNNTNQSIETVNDTLVVDTIDSSIHSAFDDASTDTLITNEDIVDGKIDYKALDEKVKTMEESKSEPEAKANKESTISKPKVTQNNTNRTETDVSKPKQPSNGNLKTGDGGPYKVMAGSYLLEANAKKMVKKLNGFGYTKAEIVVFQASGYHSVIACRHSSEKSAKSAAADLKSRGIDSFVKN